MKKALFFLVVAAALLTAYNYNGIFTAGSVHADSSKDCVNTGCTDPNRPYFDGWGNQFAYDGTLMHAVCPNQPDPISKQDNPECVCPAGYYIQGYDKTTGKAVCQTRQDRCPYADAEPADSAVCQKLTAEAQPPQDQQFTGK